MLTVQNRPPQPIPRDAYGEPLRSAPVPVAPFVCHSHGREPVPYGLDPVQILDSAGKETRPRCAAVLFLPLPSALLPAATTALVGDPSRYALFTHKADPLTLRLGPEDGSNFLTGECSIALYRRLFGTVTLSAAWAIVTGLPTS